MPVTFGAEIKEGKVYRGKRKTEDEDEKHAFVELQSLLNAKNRRPCDCEAQIHDLLENCLNCGRLSCVNEGQGKCFHCGNLVLDKSLRERLKKYVDLSCSYPTVGEQQAKQSENKRHLRGEEKQKLKDTLNELNSKKYQTKLVLNVDLDNMEAGTSTASVIDDYTREIQKLQISQPVESTSNGPTLAETLNKNAEESKKANKQSNTRDKDKNKNKNLIELLNNNDKK